MREQIKKAEIEKFNTRVDITVERGAEELLPDELYTLLSNSGIWIEERADEVVIKAYPLDIETYLEYIKKLKITIKHVNITREKQQDYGELTKKYFRPIRIEDITIVAPWHKRKTEGRFIVIEPGMAFGTGRHESTRIMMKLMRKADFAGKGVIDLGCGSAILSLYAASLGAKKVIAIDNDPDAVSSAQKNVDLNNMNNITLTCADLGSVSGRYDVVLANLDIRTFNTFSEKIKGLVKNNGFLIISGILTRNRKGVLDLFESFTQVHTAKKNSWCGFILKP